MKLEKQILKYRGLKGLLTPVRYAGKIVRISPDVVSEFDSSELPYDSKIIIDRAIAQGAVEIVSDTKSEETKK